MMIDQRANLLMPLIRGLIALNGGRRLRNLFPGFKTTVHPLPGFLIFLGPFVHPLILFTSFL